jgi:hypothetical protein
MTADLDTDTARLAQAYGLLYNTPHLRFVLAEARAGRGEDGSVTDTAALTKIIAAASIALLERGEEVDA